MSSSCTDTPSEGVIKIPHITLATFHSYDKNEPKYCKYLLDVNERNLRVYFCLYTPWTYYPGYLLILPKSPSTLQQHSKIPSQRSLYPHVYSLESQPQLFESRSKWYWHFWIRKEHTYSKMELKRYLFNVIGIDYWPNSSWSTFTIKVFWKRGSGYKKDKLPVFKTPWNAGNGDETNILANPLASRLLVYTVARKILIKGTRWILTSFLFSQRLHTRTVVFSTMETVSGTICWRDGVNDLRVMLIRRRVFINNFISGRLMKKKT